MVALALIAALVAGQGPDAGVPWPFAGGAAVLAPANGSASASQSLRLLSPGQVAVSPLPCTAAGQLNLLSGSYACLNGDGTQSSSSGMTLSAAGSPTTQTMETSPNGSNNEPVSRKRWTASDSYQSTSLSAPSGDFSVCHVGMVDAPLSAVTLVSGPGYSLSVSSAGVATFTSGGSSVSSASGAVIGGADQVICGTRSGTSGTVSVGGVRTSGTVAAPSGSAVVKVGAFVGATRGAFVSTHLLTQTDETRLVAALVPVPQTATGQLLANSRNSATWVTTSDGALVALPPGRTGVVGPPGETGVVGGVVSAQSRTNLLTWSEDFSASAWTKSNATVTANAGTAPDGSLTADTVTSTSAGGYVSQAVTTSASAYSGGVYVQTASGTQAGALQLYDVTASAQACIQAFTATTTAQRVTCATSALTASHSLQWRLYPGGTAGTGALRAWGAQLLASSVSLPYCRSEGTSATCAGDVPTIPTPSWLSTKEGCARACLAPTWSGDAPGGAELVVAGNAARFLYIASGAPGNITGYDGASFPGVATAFVSDSSKCYLSQWSASAGYFRITDLATGAVSAAVPFTGFAAFDSTIHIGSLVDGTEQPFGSILDSITLGSSPSGCN